MTADDGSTKSSSNNPRDRRRPSLRPGAHAATACQPKLRQRRLARRSLAATLDVSAAMRFHDLATGHGEFGLVVAQAGVHLGRLADMLGAQRFGVAAAGH